MANKQIDELTELTTVSGVDLVVVYDMAEAGSEKTKNIAVENFMGVQWVLVDEVDSTSMSHSWTDLDIDKRYRFKTEFTPDDPSDSFDSQSVYNDDWTQPNYVADPADFGYGFLNAPNQTGIEKIIIENIFDIPNKLIYGSSYVVKTSNGVQRNDFLIRYIPVAAITSIRNHFWNVTEQTGDGSRFSKLYIER
jgi:hypothetical protein